MNDRVDQAEQVASRNIAIVNRPALEGRALSPPIYLGGHSGRPSTR